MECLHPKYLPAREITVPCGKCAFCAATRRMDWCTRLHYEAKAHVDKSFVTLTYAEKFCPARLSKRHLQLFFKRLRKAGASFRYFAVGEYGAKTRRPHYHVLFFGRVPERSIRDAWRIGSRRSKESIGLIHVGQVTDASVAYCCAYVVDRGSNYKYQPFTVMSRRPGLGANYLTRQMIEWHRSGRKNYVQMYEHKVRLPRYWKVKIFSKIDQVRLSVKAGKDDFKRMLKFYQDHKHMRDPLAYYEDQRASLARQLVLKSKYHKNKIL